MGTTCAVAAAFRPLTREPPPRQGAHWPIMRPSAYGVGWNQQQVTDDEAEIRFAQPGRSPVITVRTCRPYISRCLLHSLRYRTDLVLRALNAPYARRIGATAHRYNMSKSQRFCRGANAERCAIDARVRYCASFTRDGRAECKRSSSTARGRPAKPSSALAHAGSEIARAPQTTLLSTVSQWVDAAWAIAMDGGTTVSYAAVAQPRQLATSHHGNTLTFGQVCSKLAIAT